MNLLVLSFLGPHLNFYGKVVPVVLESLVSGPQITLPPVNWVSVLGPIIRANFGKQNHYLYNVLLHHRWR